MALLLTVAVSLLGELWPLIVITVCFGGDGVEAEDEDDVMVAAAVAEGLCDKRIWRSSSRCGCEDLLKDLRRVSI